MILQLIIFQLVTFIFKSSVIAFTSKNVRVNRVTLTMINQISIALTRELGNNDGLKKLLENYNCIELPCIAFGPGKDLPLLNNAISLHDIVVITSPQSSQVFLKVWNELGNPKVKVATVGKGTSKLLIDNGIMPIFEPTDSTGECLSKELPIEFGKKVLYPASALADSTLQESLTERGFEVTRLNTYETIPSEWNSEQFNIAKKIDVVTFASPSTIKIWTERVGNKAHAVVIGPTSESAAKKYGYENIYAPKGSKGLEAWAELIKQTVQHIYNNRL